MGNDPQDPGGWVDVYCEQENAYLCQTVTGKVVQLIYKSNGIPSYSRML